MTEPMTEQEWIDIREFGSHAFYPVAGGRYVKLIAEVERLRLVKDAAGEFFVACEETDFGLPPEYDALHEALTVYETGKGRAT